ncbi:GTPase IMAP family member 7-like [Ylistrum balloti]|uniref:GTPase IMAP family member 7-like n=1 Tax=Ylistrum balloti TaxID=509963 RepID=UPI002905A733|nr:GTPase IMAP family member 7-like [Ylistrum balloti]
MAATNQKWFPPTGDSSNQDLHIVLIGKTGAGKSATGNTLIGENILESRGGYEGVTRNCLVKEFKRFGTKLVLVDTPGFCDIKSPKEWLAEQLVSCTCLAYPGVHIFLLVLKVGERYSPEDQNALESIKEMFGENFVKHTIVVFTCKDTLEADGLDFQSEKLKLPNGMQEIIKSCKGGNIVISNRATADVREQEAERIIFQMKKVVQQNGGGSKYYRTALFDKIAEEIEKRINQIMKGNAKIEKKIKLLQNEMDLLTREDQHEQRRKLEKDIEALKKDIVGKGPAQAEAVQETRTQMLKRVAGYAAPVCIAGIITICRLLK